MHSIEALELFTHPILHQVRTFVLESILAHAPKQETAERTLRTFFGVRLDSSYIENNQLYLNLVGNSGIKTIRLGTAGTDQTYWKQYDQENPGYNACPVPAPQQPPTLEACRQQLQYA